MINSLREHISSILSMAKIDKTNFTVNRCGIDIIPETLKCVHLTHEYVIILKVVDNKHIRAIVQKLQVLLGKEVKITDDNTQLYWFDGEVKSHELEIDNYIKTIVEGKRTNSLKSHVQLPKWLDDYIFQNLGAVYSPDHNRFDYNLDLDKDENHIYLGTYFPRSFAESYSIFRNLLKVAAINDIYSTKSELNILDVGSGTGGDCLGLLCALEECYDNITHITILCIDGNTEALHILEDIINFYSQRSKIQIILITEEVLIDDVLYKGKNIYKLPANTLFDFVTSSKMVCELVKNGHNNAYYDYTKKFLPLLSDEGVFLLLDVTTKHNGITYNPILLNKGVNMAILEMDQYKTISPIPCRKYACTCNCFTQKIFSIEHTRRNIDTSKVAYRIVVRNAIAEAFPDVANDIRYVVKGDISNTNNEYCTAQGHLHGILCDAYNLKTK